MSSKEQESTSSRREFIKTSVIASTVATSLMSRSLASAPAAKIDGANQPAPGNDLTSLVSTNTVRVPLVVDQQNLRVTVDVENAHWSASLKGTDVALNGVHFLPEDAPEGWTITCTRSGVDMSKFGDFETVTLHGVKPGHLDFDYHLSVSNTGNEIIVSLDRANDAGKAIDIDDMDYMVVDDARLGGTHDKWISFGVRSIFSEYYDLTSVSDLPILNQGDFGRRQKMYEVSHLVRNINTGHAILMGHMTVHKGHSRFEVARRNVAGSMRMRAYCTYAITMPPGKRFDGEKMLVYMGNDALRALERQGDLISLANDINLKVKRPLDLEDKALIGFTHCRWMVWASGGKAQNAANAFQKYGLYKFYYGGVGKNPEYGKLANWGLYYCGGGGQYSNGTTYRADLYLPIHVQWGDGRVLDFSLPAAVDAERRRIAKTYAGEEKRVNWAHLDFAENWDLWTGQDNRFMSGVETWRAGASPWRDYVDQFCPRLRNRACMSKVDFNYGFVDLQRVSEDSDGMYVPDAYAGGPDARGLSNRAFLGECAIGNAMRFFYNTRVFWNDGDNLHVYRYDGGREMPYGQAKVVANYKGLTTSCAMPSEAFDVEYPHERLELLKRVAPPTADAAYPVDLFERKPAAVWNLPVERPFGRWCVLGVFNYADSSDFTVTLDAAKDLRLNPNKEYVVYEFWSKKLIGTFKGRFISRLIPREDCDIYSVVEKMDRPVLVSTSRHIRQMAFDIKDMAWDGVQKMLSGLSRAVSGDPYQLRFYVPDGFSLKGVKLPAALIGTTATSKGGMGQLLLTIDFTTSSDDDHAWEVSFV